MKSNNQFVILTVLAMFLVSCNREEKVIPPKKPRPVSIKKLIKRKPPNTMIVSASVAPWKTEQIGFEVGGRVEFVVEPNTLIKGRTFDKKGQLISEGTPIGRLESERFQIAVEKAESDIKQANQNLISSKIQLERSIPAEIDSAQATLNRTQVDLERSRKLFERKAGPKSDVDKYEAEYKSAVAEIDRLNASLKAQEADVATMQAALMQAKQNLRDAQRDLEDCTLYSSYTGQIADISVVPGSFVSQGQSVVTIQSMNPIKAQFEVSAEISRLLQKTEILPVTITLPNGSRDSVMGYRYLIDSVADANTRTFTVELLIFNQQISTFDHDDSTVTTEGTWRLDLDFLTTDDAHKDKLFVEEKILNKDAQGDYVWLVTNFSKSKPRSLSDPTPLEVRRLYVKLQPRKVPYLGGNWVFQEVTIDDPEFDPADSIITDKLNFKNMNPDNWQDNKVVFNQMQWMLRPGDLVTVDLSTETEEGYYLPMAAITREADQAYLFTATTSAGKTLAKRIPVSINTQADQARDLVQVTFPEDLDLSDMGYITKGAHYLIDGEAIKPVEN